MPVTAFIFGLYMKQDIFRFVKWVIIPAAYALIVRLLLGGKEWENLYGVMTVWFMFGLPAIVGALTLYLSTEEKARKISYRLLAPWLPILIFLILTLLISIEGWACWVMALPVFFVSGSVGGVIGGYIRSKKKNNKTYLSFLVLSPLFAGPIESLIDAIPGTYKAYTFIDIQAPADKIWSNVTRVKEIPEEQDKGWLTRSLGFPRPVKAELNYEGLGAYREAIFTNGLVFHETVTEYIDKQKMVFSIKAYPHEIPAATMDEHVVIGGKYFDVLNGTYELEKLNDSAYRLHLYSHFKLTTTFNFYAGWWAKWIMKDIQNNILQVEKKRAEMKL